MNQQLIATWAARYANTPHLAEKEAFAEALRNVVSDFIVRHSGTPDTSSIPPGSCYASNPPYGGVPPHAFPKDPQCPEPPKRAGVSCGIDGSASASPLSEKTSAVSRITVDDFPSEHRPMGGRWATVHKVRALMQESLGLSDAAFELMMKLVVQDAIDGLSAEEVWHNVQTYQFTV
jgi:hypothetical protein